MEFHEKLQQLRKQRGLTQEELAQALYVSRTAISKWESGRGYPSIDSLKAIAAFFSVTIDELLSGGEMLTLAEKDRKQKDRRQTDLLFGTMDISTAALLFLPFFVQESAGMIRAVSLMSMTAGTPYVRTVYFAVVSGSMIWGILTLAHCSIRCSFSEKVMWGISLLLNAAGTLLFVTGRHPYASTLLLVFLAIKVLLLAGKTMTRSVSSV